MWDELVFGFEKINDVSSKSQIHLYITIYNVVMTDSILKVITIIHSFI